MKVFRTLLFISFLCAYAGCALNQPSDLTLSHQISSQQFNQNSEQPQQLPMKNLSIQTASENLVHFRVQVADTNDTRMIGLMYRESMSKDEGMIFLFDREQPLTFWMKNTLIPLDMIFIDKDWKVVSIQKNAEPCKADPCPLYPSSQNAQYVLEINGGLSDKLGIQLGGVVTLNDKL